MKVNYQEMNWIIKSLDLVTDFVDSEKEVTITKEMIENDETDGDLEGLEGYKVKLVKVKGDHRNDGQMVDYTFRFISPDNKTTTIKTEMCLMVGWNFGEYHGDGYDI